MSSQNPRYIERFVNLLDPEQNTIFNMSVEQATQVLGSGDAERLRDVQGQFALVHRDGQTVRMARTIGCPMRYFLAKQIDGPCLVVAQRIDQLRDWLNDEGLGDQFHPSYTRMVPAHHVVQIELVGCPDPNPQYLRFFNPQRNRLPTDLDQIGLQYVGALQQEINHWLDHMDDREPIGVMFSGGIDSGAVFCVLYHTLLARGQSPARLKAFTLSVSTNSSDARLGDTNSSDTNSNDDAKLSSDARQAFAFLDSMGLGMFWEMIDVGAEAIDYRQAIAVLEDYKPLDVQAGAMTLALCRELRRRYSDWTYLIDGDGGDENFKDYPIEENSELTIRSVLNNLMLYQEGWGVNAIKHSLTYSGGQSRGHVRSSAPATQCGFQCFSPLALPNVIEVAEGIPFIELTDWDHERLYQLKGEIVRRGVQLVTGLQMPVYPKRRFQHGALADASWESLFPADEADYRQALQAVFA